jgi:hypothetical protein
MRSYFQKRTQTKSAHKNIEILSDEMFGRDIILISLCDKNGRFFS